MFRLTLLPILLAVTTAQIWGTEAKTFAEAKSLAQETSKLILMDFWSDN